MFVPVPARRRSPSARGLGNRPARSGLARAAVLNVSGRSEKREKTAAKGTRQQPQGTLPPPAQATCTDSLREQEPVIFHLLAQQLAERGLALY